MDNGLSVFYILRNEQDYVGKSMQRIKGVADEIIAIDCCSIDKTVEICKGFGAKIYRYKWDDDFSSIRNFAISKCTKKWIMFVNADELIDGEGVEVINKLVKQSSTKYAYSFKIKDVVEGWDFSSNHLDPPYSASPQIRLFPNKPSIKFYGKANESVDKSVHSDGGMIVEEVGVSLVHHLFRGQKGNKETQEGYYRKISGVKDKVKIIEKNFDNSNRRCAIVIVAHNVLHLTKRCVESLVENTEYPYKLYLVDNGSSDGTGKFMKSISNAEVIHSDKNTGIATGRNLGMKEALKDPNNKYICCIDNDTSFYGEWLSDLVAHLDSDEKCGVVGPVTNYATGSQRIVKSSWVGRLNYSEIIEKAKSKYNGNFKEVEFVDGFCLVLRSKDVSEIGLFDDEFDLIGWEDRDYCRRIKASSKTAAISSLSFVHHHGKATSTFNSMDYYRSLQRSAKHFHEKWITPNNEMKLKKDRSKRKNLGRPFTSIVVLTYNNLQINKRFYNAIKEYTNNYELIFIDNGSTDGTVDFLESLDGVTLVKNEKNTGVIKARNVGINLASHDFIICLDNDQIVKEGWLDKMFTVMDCGYDFVGVEAWKVNKDYAPIKRYSRNDRGVEIDYVGAGGCLMKRDVLNDIGIFDERFSPAYYEDVDLSFRAKKAGYKIGWCRDSVINHLEHSTLIHGQKDFVYSEALSSSRRLFADKWARILKGEDISEKSIRLNRVKELGEKKITFCMCLKGRASAARESIVSLVTSESIKHFNFIVTEDESGDMLNLDDFKYKAFVDHYIISTGERWNRSKVCNYGFKKASTQYVASWDADFIFPENFAERFMGFLKDNDPDDKNEYLRFKCTETEDCVRNGREFKRGEMYGGLYVYSSSKLREIRGYDEDFKGYGWEEIDFHARYGRQFSAKENKLGIRHLVNHTSHDEAISGSKDMMKANEMIKLSHDRSGVNIVNDSSWGDSVILKRMAYSKPLTFCMCLKNRKDRALKSIASVVSYENSLIADFVIVEDESADMVNLGDTEYSDFVRHYKVKTGDKWNRGKLLNYGSKIAASDFVSFWDADFIFSAGFVSDLADRVLALGNDKYYVVDVPSYETHSSVAGGTPLVKGDRYGSIWTYSLSLIHEVRGFDERFLGWGREEKDLKNRCVSHMGAEYVIMDDLKVDHLSHSNDIRSFCPRLLNENDRIMKENIDKKISKSNEEWGELCRI